MAPDYNSDRLLSQDAIAALETADAKTLMRFLLSTTLATRREVHGIHDLCASRPESCLIAHRKDRVTTASIPTKLTEWRVWVMWGAFVFTGSVFGQYMVYQLTH
jgi:hypothetical protein